MSGGFFPFRPGDRMLDIVLPGVDERTHKLSWSFQGQPLALIALSELRQVTDGVTVELLTALAEVDAHAVLVVPAGVPATVAALTGFEMPGTGGVPLTLCDPDRRTLHTLLAPDAATGSPASARHDQRVMVLDANQRLVAEFVGGEALARREAVLAAVEVARADRPAPSTVHGGAAPVLMLPRVFEPAFCRALIELWRRHDHVDGGVSSRYGNMVSNDHKRTEDHVVTDEATVRQISDRLAYRIGPELERVFNWSTDFVFDAHVVLSYDADGGHFFRPHRDNGAPQTADRAFAVSLNLNDDYAGGELTFPEFGPTLYRPRAGMAAVFSCSLLHEALPVTQGRRFVLTTFFRDRRKRPPSAAQR